MNRDALNLTQDHIMARFYLTIRQVEARHYLDAIFWRFYTILFVRLGRYLGYEKQNHHAHFHQRIVTVLTTSAAVTDTAAEIHANIKRWTTIGAKYQLVCDQLGSGALFLLPTVFEMMYVHDNCRIIMCNIHLGSRIRILRESQTWLRRRDTSKPKASKQDRKNLSLIALQTTSYNRFLSSFPESGQ